MRCSYVNKPELWLVVQMTDAGQLSRARVAGATRGSGILPDILPDLSPLQTHCSSNQTAERTEECNELPGWDLPNAKEGSKVASITLFREKNTDTAMQALAGMCNPQLFFFQTRVAKIPCCGLCDSNQNYDLFDRMSSPPAFTVQPR